MLEARLHLILTALQGSGRPPQQQRRRLMALDDHASSSTMGNRGVELAACDQCSFVGMWLMSLHIDYYNSKQEPCPKTSRRVSNQSSARSATTSTSGENTAPSPRKVEREPLCRQGEQPSISSSIGFNSLLSDCLPSIEGHIITVSTCQRVDTTSTAVGAQA